MYRIKLNDGTELDATMAAEANGILTARLFEPMTVADGAALFENKEKTAVITIDDPFGNENILRGFTFLVGAIREQNNGRLTVNMAREE